MAKVNVFSRSSKCDSRIKHKKGIQARASNHTLAARLQLAGTELPSRGLGLETRSHVPLLAVRKLIGQRPHFGTACANQPAEKSKNSAQHATTDMAADGGRGSHLALALLRHAAHHFLSYQLVLGGFG